MNRRKPAREEPSPAPVRSGSERESYWVLLVLAGSLAPLVAILSAGYTLVWRDTARMYAPLRGLIAEALRQGRLPLWNPYEALGTPLFAQLLHSVLHPWSILAAFVAPADGMDLMIVLHVATGALGAGVLARTLGTSSRGAAIAGLGYGLSGYLLGVSGVIEFLAAAGTAPWVVAGLRAAALGGSARLAFGCIAVAILHFAGDPQWSIAAVGVGVLLAWDSRGRQGLARSATAVVAGTALAAIQLIPSWALLQASSRGDGLSLLDQTQWAFAPARLIEFVIPGFFVGRLGTNSAPVYSWLGGESTFALPFVPSVFIGLPILVLAVSGVRSGRAGRLLGAAALFFLWVSLGRVAGAGSLLGWIPVWGSFRYAEKVVGPLTLCIATLAALGLERFVDRTLPGRARRFLIASAVLALLAALAAILSRVAAPTGIIPPDAWSPVWQRGALGFLLAAAGLAAIAWVGHRRDRTANGRTRVEWGIVAVVWVTGVVSSLAGLHVGSRESRARMPLAELHQVEPVPRIITPVKEIGVPAQAQGDDFDVIQAVQSRSGAAPYAVPARVDNFTTYTGLPPKRFSDVVGAFQVLGDARWIAFRRFAVTHVVLTPPLTGPDQATALAAVDSGSRVRADSTWNVTVWEVPHSPWVRFAADVLAVDNEAAALQALLSLAGSGDGRTVLLATAVGSLSTGRVHSFERRSETVTIDAEAPGDGLLIVADAFWEGWEATLDSRPVEIEMADGLIRAVRWPAGRHVLVMRYRPPEVRLGLWVSAFTALVLLAALGRSVFLERTRSPVAPLRRPA